MKTNRCKTFLLLGTVLTAVFARTQLAFGAAQLIPEHQHRLGSCPDGSSCDWDCGGAQCDLGLGAQLCADDSECPGFDCRPGPICAGTSRTACDLPLISTFRGRLVVRADENDTLCAAPGTGCNLTDDDDCGSKVTFALRGRKADASEFAIAKDLDLCNTGSFACSTNRDCNQCLDGFVDEFDCPRTDPVLLCNGQGGHDIPESDLAFGNFGSWLNDIQPFAFLKDDLPADLQVGIPTVVGAVETSSGSFCSGTEPRTSCDDDTDCAPNGSCYTEAEYCVTIGLLKGRCLGDTDDGTLCSDNSECDSGNCGIAGLPNIAPLLSDDQDLTLASLGPCGGCPASPSPSCESAFEACQLLVDDEKPGKEKLVAAWKKGPALAGTDFGNPLNAGGTAYDLCVYDEGGAFAGQYSVDRAGATCGAKPCWKPLGEPPPDPKHKGYRYKDADATSQGIRSVLLKGGEPEKTKAVVKGKNNAEKGLTSLPTGTAAALAGSTSATIQLHGSGAPKCVSCLLSTTKDEGVKFKAKK